MSFDFHKNRSVYFKHQYENAREFLFPFTGITQKRVLEIGCGEGGVLKAYVDQGMEGVGVELSKGKYELAKQHFSEDIFGW